jgi:multidrug efflux system membrane fusion protein
MNLKQKRVVWLVVVILAAATLIYLTRWRGHAETAAPRGRFNPNQPVAVQLATARSGSIDVTIDALGTVTARNTAVVHARVDGLLQKIKFTEGRVVKAGDLLAEIDPRPFDAALTQARGQLARDQALLESARIDLKRYQSPGVQESIPQQQVDAQASLVHQYEGAVQSDQGNVANAQLQRDFTRITAPITGRAGLRQVDVGNMVHAADVNGIVVLTEAQPIYVEFAIPVAHATEVIQRWSSNTPLKVEAYGADGKTLVATGRLDSADNQVDLTTSTVKFKALFANTDGALFPNQFVNARVTLNTLDNQVLIPRVAVQRGTPGTFVYVLGSDSTVQMRNIAVGVTNGDSVAITSGLKAGEQVVTQGTDKLRDGANVQSAAEPPPVAPGRHKGAWNGKRHGNQGTGASGTQSTANP